METGQFAAGFAARHAQAPKAKPQPQALTGARIGIFNFPSSPIERLRQGLSRLGWARFVKLAGRLMRPR